MSNQVLQFVEQWTSQNIHNQAGLDPTDYISDQVEQLIDDAEAKGISEDELETAVGDLEEYLRAAYAKIEDSD
ncbi:hypothetical protein ACQR14_36345, partial [Bradyrhizobium oligotrophicum]